MAAILSEATGRNLGSRIKSHSSAIMSTILFLLGVVAVYKLLSTVDIHLVYQQLKQISPNTMWLAVGTTLLGYLTLTGYDWSAIRYLGKSVPTPILVMGSFTAYAMSNTVGLAVVSGGAVRHRFYRGLGLDAADIAVVASFCALSFGMGVTIVGFAALAYHPAALSGILSANSATIRVISLIAIAIIVSLLLWGSRTQRAVKIGRFNLSIPKINILGAQLLFSVLDITLAGLTLYILLPAEISLPFSTFLAIFAAAAVISTLSHVPGGIGVFEGIIIAGVATTSDLIPVVTAALLVYRVIYYLFPFILSIILLTAAGPILNSAATARRLPNFDIVLSVFEFLNPALISGLSALIFLTGAALLLNGILPIPQDILNEIAPLVHFGAFELSSIILGVVGAALIILSNGLRRRIKGAFWIVFSAMIVGIGALLTQKIDYDLLIFMLLSTLLLFLSRDQFYRSSKLTTRIMSFEWLLLCGGLALTALLLLLFAHEYTDYQHHQWWEFGLDNQLSRALRAYATGVAVAVLILLFMSLRPAREAPVRAAEFDADLVASIIDQQGDPDAHFVFTGDKHVLMSENSDAFIMYAPQRRSLIALGDPIGNPASRLSIIEAFIDLGDRHNYRPCFYKVGSEHLTSYIDFGFSLSKLGEEAVVNLTEFTLDGPGRKKLRASFNRANRDGLSFEILQPPFDSSMINRLAQVSDDWLESKNVQEKGFSLGRFDEPYLQRSPLAVVRHNDVIVAFANVLLTSTHQGATIDLMRHTQDAPSGSMEFLFTSLMLQLKAEGYQELSLGMVPLTGLSQSRNKRLWDHIGLAVSRFGGHFYNFSGLRAYKDKFGSQWRPHYIATWGGTDPLLVAADVNALVSGGLLGAIYKPARS